MPTRVRIAFATCRGQSDILRQVAPRFSAIADIETLPCMPDGVEGAIPALLHAAPHIIVTDSKWAGYLAERVEAPVILFELTADVLAARIGEARQMADTIAVLPLEGSMNPAVRRILERTAGRFLVLPWSDYGQLRSQISRCRRMGVEAVIGGVTATTLAEHAGMQGHCVYDRPAETDGVLSQMIFTAAAQAMPRLVHRRVEVVATGLILEKICEGLIGPHDTVLCLDANGTVIAVYAHTCDTPECSGPPSAISTGIPLFEVLGVLTRQGGGQARDVSPLQLDVYPLSQTGYEGSVAVMRGEPRPGIGPAGHGSRPD